MKTAWDAIQWLTDNNVEHRSGWKMQEIPPLAILGHARDELKELFDAPDDKEEIADTIASLFHYAQVKGVSYLELEQLILVKLSKRFNKFPLTE